jgi:hypothetical protein
MTQISGRRPTTTAPQLKLNVALLSESDQRSPLVTTSQLDAILALLGVGQVEVTS